MTGYGIIYKQRDILVIPVPFTDLSSHKKRPVLVISNDGYNCKTEDIIVTAITSNVDKKDFAVAVTSKDMESGKMPYDSLIRSDKIYTLDKSIVVKKIGVLNEAVFAKVKENLQRLIK